MPSHSIELKSPREIEALKVSGQMTAGLLEMLCSSVKSGISTEELDRMAVRWIREHNAKPAFLNYRGFPKTICVSINEEVVHGIPGPRKIKDGDIVSIDVGLFFDGWYGDTARTVAVGKISPQAAKLLSVSARALADSMEAAKAGNRLGDVSNAMQAAVEAAGFSVVREYGGHGIGRALHEDPHVPCYGTPGTGIRLEPGMVLALEVMANAGGAGISHRPDQWTVVTADRTLSAHFEHMVAITEKGPVPLTQI